MEIRSEYGNFNEVLMDDQTLCFEDKALSSYIYEKNYRQINLGGREMETDFLKSFLSEGKIVSMCNIYLAVLKDSDLKKYESLKHGEEFDLEEVLTSLSKALLSDFQKNGIVLAIQETKGKKDYMETNPLKEILERPYMHSFFEGLHLSYSERVLLVLALADREWGWLFPAFRDERYKAGLFCHICSAVRKDEAAYSRRINSRLIKLGLFSSPWKIQDYVYSFFKNETPAFTIQAVPAGKDSDLYDYREIMELNGKALKIMGKLNGFMTVCSESDFRNRNLIASAFRQERRTVYEMKREFNGAGKGEIKFYIYALSVKTGRKKSFLFVGGDISGFLSDDSAAEDFSIEKESTSSILEYVKIPVIISTSVFSETERKEFLANGIDVLYAMKLRLPEVKKYRENAADYFFGQKVPVKFLHAAVEECERLGVPPEQWNSVASVLKDAESLTGEEAVDLMRNRYGLESEDYGLRKNSCYCIEALNTSEPVDEVTDALRNADEFQKGEYDADSGIKILLYGISGGGKTSYAEEVSKKMNRKLRILRPTDVLSKYVGETEQNISRIFKESAEEHSILLIDEADSFLHRRGDSVNHFEDSKVNSFLIEIERYPGILFCSTNMPDSLDGALDRRFNFKVGFYPLTKKGVSLLCGSYFPSFEINDSQISMIYGAGDVTPGDFASMNGKLRFLPPEKKNAEYVTEQLARMVREKGHGCDSKRIGFGA